MNPFKKIKEVGVKQVAKKKVKDAVNSKFNLDGQYDDKIDDITNKTIDVVGVDNILKAKKLYDKVSKS
jgi:hypothetical protein